MSQKKGFDYKLCSDLFVTGLLDGINFKYVVESLAKSKKLFITLILHFVVMLGVLGGIFFYLSTHTINVKEFVIGDSPFFPLSLLGNLPPSLFYMGFIFLPWLGGCYVISGQFGSYMTNILRSESELNSKPKYYKPKELTTSEQRPIFKLFRLVVNFGLTLVPYLGIMLQNIVIGMIPIPIIGRLASMASNTMYFAYNIFSQNWVTISVNPSSSSLFPSSLEILDRFRYIERNWPYFAGFVFPTIFTSIVLIPTLIAPAFPAQVQGFPGPLFFTTIQIFGMITAWNVVEKSELHAIQQDKGNANANASSKKKKPTAPEGYFRPLGPDQTRFTKEGILPYPYPIFSYVPEKFTEVVNKIFKED